MATITLKQQLVFKALQRDVSKGVIRPLGKVLLEAGYSPYIARQPSRVIKSLGFQELLDDLLPDDALINTHKTLLEAKAIDHLVFPLAMSDEEITELIESTGGTVRKFKHGDTATHCWFWAPNTKARQDALKLAYDIKGKLKANGDPAAAASVYNTFIQQNNINPNAPSAKELVEASLDALMAQTKRKVIDI